MFIDMACQCGASMQLDGVNEMFTLVMSNRFAEAHVSCGYMTRTADAPKPKRENIIKPLALQEDDDE